MPAYFVDTNVFRALGHYFPGQFPSVWENIEKIIAEYRFLSVREVLNEIKVQATQTFIQEWCRKNRSIFLPATAQDAIFIQKIFQVQHFRALVKRQNLLKGLPVADPFLIAAAKNNDGIIVTEESRKENSARIPNVAEYFGIQCISLEQMLNKEGWRF